MIDPRDNRNAQGRVDSAQQDPRAYQPPDNQQRRQAPPPRLSDPRAHDPAGAVPATRARPAIHPGAEQSYVPQFDRYEVPQRTGATMRQAAIPQAGDNQPPRTDRRPPPPAPPRGGGQERLDPGLFGASATPRAGTQAPLPARAPAAVPPGYGNSDRFEPQFDSGYGDRRGQQDHVAAGYEDFGVPVPATTYQRSTVPATRQQPAVPQQLPPSAGQNWQNYDGAAENTADPEDGDAPFDDQEDDYELDDDEAPPRGRRLLMAAGAIGLAVLIGAGVGFGYKFFGTGDTDGEPLVVAANLTPVKKKAADATAEAGKKSIFRIGEETSTDSTVVSREETPVTQASLNGVAGAAMDLAAEDGVTQGPRKVATVAIRPGDTIDTSADAGAMASAGDAEVPGISLAGSGDTEPAPPVKQATAKVKKGAQVQTKQVVQETAADVAAASDAALGGVEQAIAPLQETAEPASQPVAPVKKVKLAKVQPKPAVIADDAGSENLGGPALDNTMAAVETAPPVVKPASGGGQGYVAQVRASKSRVDALGSFADIQQRYVDVLGNSQPDIQEADLGAKGIWYRLRIGPPASKKMAGDLCSQLKAKGMKDCIVVAY